TISWEYAPKSEGAYALVYQCQDNLFFVTPSLPAQADSTGVMNRIPCGAALILSSTTTAISLTPVASGESDISVPISIAFVSSADSAAEAQGSATVVVGQPTAAPAVNPPTPPQESAPEPTQATTPPDLSVRIVSVSADEYGQGVATFDISNVGGSSSGGYYFEAQLPTTVYGQGYKYTSPLQKSLAPGDHVVSTLRFTQATNGAFSVTVDPSGSVREATETNNYAYQTLSAPYNQPVYYNNQPQPADYGTGQPYYQYDPNQPQTYYMY
ncbi:MAG: CARDB domain-containing protein, partial [bacterium]|nr:CARDB domain-containing protein [bacterium]